MDFGDIAGNLPLILGIIGLILLQFFLMRRRKPQRAQEATVQSLLTEVRMNQVLIETSHLRQKPRKFVLTSWQLNKNKLDFLDQSLQRTLSDAFLMIEDFNQQIAAAKKYKSPSYMANVYTDKLKEPLAKSRQGLEEWLMSTVGTSEPPPKYPGTFDDLLGKR